MKIKPLFFSFFAVWFSLLLPFYLLKDRQITILIDNVQVFNDELRFIWPIYIVYVVVALAVAILYADLVTNSEGVRFLEEQNRLLSQKVSRLSYENEVLKFKPKNEN
jgi:hypothetical protein